MNAKQGTYDVSMDSGDSKSMSSNRKEGLQARHLGQIAEDANRIVLIINLEHRNALTEATATALNHAQVSPPPSSRPETAAAA